MEIDSSQFNSDEIKLYLQILWRWAWLMAFLAVLGGVLTFVYSTRQAKIYKASATVLIDNPQASTDIYYTVYVSDRVTQTYSQMIVQQPTLVGVIEELGLDVSVEWLQKNMWVEVIENTQLLRISIEDTDPERAAAIVNSIGTVFGRTNAELQASRYRETKDSLEAQMVSMDKQIQDTSQQLDQAKVEVDSDPKQDILLVQLETYRGIYQDILKQIVEAETQSPVDETGLIVLEETPIEEQLAFAEGKIKEISEKIAAFGYYPTGPDFEILSAQLLAYKNLYNQLFKDLVASENSISIETGEEEADPSKEAERLTTQLDIVAQRIGALTKEINGTGSGTDGNIERDRMESNLALYRQTYAGLVQSYEEVRLSEIQNTSRVDLVQPATPPTDPIRPNMSQNTILGTLAGLMIGAGVAFLIEMLDDTVKGAGEIEQRMELPVLGYIMRMEDGLEYPVAALEPRSPIAESFRSLRTNIQFASIDRPLYSLMITSPTPSDGKSTVAANLGVVLGQMTHKVGLIDADLRKPAQHKIFNLPNRIGLSETLVQPDLALNGNFKETKVENLNLLTTGDLPPNPSELIGSDRMLNLIQGLEDNFDFVIIDTPPVMAVTDPVVLSTRIDGVIVVVRPGVTKLAAAVHTADQLKQVGANILGVVLNDVENKGARYSQYYKGHYYQYGKYYNYSSEGKKKKRKFTIKGKSGRIQKAP